jgi:hypothetical protein
MWRYRYNGETNEKWFTSGEAVNLACNPIGHSDDGVPCQPGVKPNNKKPNEVADERGWVNVPHDQVDMIVNQSQIQTYHNQWNMTTVEKADAESDMDTDFASPSNLPFGVSSIENMIEDIVSIIN